MVILTGTGLASAKRAPQPKAHATPHTNLTNGETVTVTGSNFVPGTQVYVVQCSKGIKGKNTAVSGEPYCGIYNYDIVTVTPTGAIPSGTTFTVYTGDVTVNGTTCGTSTTDKVCYLGVGDAQNDKDDSALARITFALPKP
ncbi:MAG: hypothetical protein ABSG81_12900 [Acidimicrobiales bacterium]